MHETLGVALLPVTLLRLWVRRRNPPPPLPAAMNAAMRATARLVHAALYALLLALPVIGYVATDTGGNRIRFLGLVTLPSLVGRHDGLASVLVHMHFLGTMTLLALAAAHVGAVAFHQAVMRDGLARRMV